MKICRFLSALMILVVVTCLSGSSVSAKSKNICISKKTETILVGETCKLKIKNTKSTVEWKTGDSSIATVDQNGVVTGISEGTTKITGCIGTKKYSCTLTVEKNDKVVFVWPSNEYSELVASAISNSSKKADVDIDDENITVAMSQREVDRLVNKTYKEYVIGLSTIYYIECNDYKTYDYYANDDCTIDGYSYLINRMISPILIAYLNGYTEKDIKITIHEYINNSNEYLTYSMYDVEDTLYYDDPVPEEYTQTIDMPSVEEIYSYSEKGI